MNSLGTAARLLATCPRLPKGVEATARLSKGINTDFFFFPFLNFIKGIVISKSNLFAEEDAMS